MPKESTAKLLKLEDIRLTMKERAMHAVRAGIQAIPAVGGTIAHALFGIADEKRIKRIEIFLEEVARDIGNLEELARNVSKKYFESDDFIFLFENVLHRAAVEVHAEKLAALRGALVSIIVKPNKNALEMRSHFLRALDVVDPVHIHVLRLLATHRSRPESNRYLRVKDVWKALNARDEAQQSFVYAAFDTLANKEFIISGPVPWTKDNRIDKASQAFRVTALGLGFLEFVRDGEMNR